MAEYVCDLSNITSECSGSSKPYQIIYFDLDVYLDTVGLNTFDLNNLYEAGNYRFDTTKHTYLNLPDGYTGKNTIKVGGYHPLNRSLTFQEIKHSTTNNISIRTQTTENTGIVCFVGDDNQTWSTWSKLYGTGDFNINNYYTKTEIDTINSNFIRNRGNANYVTFSENIRTTGTSGLHNQTYGGAVTFSSGLINMNQPTLTQGTGYFSGDVVAYYNTSSPTGARDITVSFLERRITEIENMRDQIQALINNSPAPTPKPVKSFNMSVEDIYNRQAQLYYDYQNLLNIVQGGLIKIVKIPLRNRSGNLYDATDLDLSAYSGWNFVIIQLPRLSGGRGETEYDELFMDLPKSVDSYWYRSNVRHNLVDKQGYGGIGSMVFSLVDKKFSLLASNGYAPMQKVGYGEITFLFYKN